MNEDERFSFTAFEVVERCLIHFYALDFRAQSSAAAVVIVSCSIVGLCERAASRVLKIQPAVTFLASARRWLSRIYAGIVGIFEPSMPRCHPGNACASFSATRPSTGTR